MQDAGLTRCAGAQPCPAGTLRMREKAEPLDVSFGTFVSQVLSTPPLALTTLLTLGVIFVNGWTDAPNAIATCVTTRCMRVRPAIIMSACLNFMGVLIMTHLNASVASTISNMVDFGGNTDAAMVALCAALFSIVVYSVAASVFGKAVTIVCAGLDRRRADGFFRSAQIFGAGAMSFMHGAQDGQKFIGVLFLGMAFCNGQSSVAGVVIPVWLMLLCSATMGIGTSVGGEPIIKSVGMDMVKLEKYQGFSADLASSLCLLLMTALGIPVSTTHTKTSSIMGVGAVRRLSAINFGVVKDMMLTWVFTFPGCGLISFFMAKLFMFLF